MKPWHLVALTIIGTMIGYVWYKKYFHSSILSSINTPSFKKLVLIRHGEKPSDGLGNLNCKGLNRSLALPNVLLSKYGKPDYIFAPNPARKVMDHGISYNYIRPLVTIEPTAIKCNLPIDSDYGFTDIDGLLHELSLDKYRDKTIFVAWEHKNLDKFAKMFAQKYVGPNSQLSKTESSTNGTFAGMFNGVPNWPSNDFDSIFIFTRHPNSIIGTSASGSSVFSSYVFSIEHEGLNGVSSVCPV